MTRAWTGAGLLALLALAAGCDDTPSQPLNGVPALDAALLAAQETQGDVETMREPGVPGLAFPRLRFPSLDGQRPDCPEEGHRFRCPPQDQDGVSVTHEVTFMDAGGGTQDAYDEAATAQVVFDMSMSGSGLPPRGRPGHRGHERGVVPLESSVERSRSLTASGLEGDNETVVWNGTGASQSTHTFQVDGETWTRTASTTSTVDQVVLPYPREEGSWPLSGTVTQHVVFSGAGPGGDQTREVDAVVTFNGTSVATITVNGETFEVDLSKRGRRGFGGHAR